MSVILEVFKSGLILVVVYLIAVRFLKWRKVKKELSWLSSPRTLPIIGNAHHLLGITTTDIPHLFRKWNQTFGSAYIYWVGLDPVINCQDPYLNQVLSNAGRQAEKSIEYYFLSAYLGKSLLTSAGDEWYKKRKLITPCFHYEILDSFLDTMNKQARKLVRYMDRYAQSGESFDFFPKAKLCTLDVLMETSMGSNVNFLENENDPYVHAVAQMRNTVMTRSLSLPFRSDIIYNLSSKKNEQNKSVEVLQTYVRRVINSRREARRNSQSDRSEENKSKKKQALLEMLLDLADSGAQIDDQQIENEVNTFIFAGHDTASVALSYNMFLMAKHPHIQERVYKELVETIPNFQETGLTQNGLNKLEYLDRCVKESMRILPPVPLIGKNLTQPIETDKGLLPAGVNITQNIYNLHHNEEYYPNPEIYDPDRFLPENSTDRNPYTYIPFGSGARNCIGQRFALNEVKTLLCYLMMNYKVATDMEFDDLNIGFDIVLTPTNGVRIKLQRRQAT